MTRLSSAFPAERAALAAFISADAGDAASNLCGRGDKDIFTVTEALGTKI